MRAVKFPWQRERLIMEEQERLNALQALLTEAYLDYVNVHRRKVGDNEFARWLGVSVGSYNQWINGNRLPSYDNVIRLAAKLGPRVFDVMGYDRVMVVADPQLLFLAERWGFLDHDTRDQIIEHVKEETVGKEPAKQAG
jgi:transcriptional regulator with XRE-family HTH domain